LDLVSTGDQAGRHIIGNDQILIQDVALGVFQQDPWIQVPFTGMVEDFRVADHLEDRPVGIFHDDDIPVGSGNIACFVDGGVGNAVESGDGSVQDFARAEP